MYCSDIYHSQLIIVKVTNSKAMIVINGCKNIKGTEGKLFQFT